MSKVDTEIGVRRHASGEGKGGPPKLSLQYVKFVMGSTSTLWNDLEDRSNP